jgi:hypothetical protein
MTMSFRNRGAHTPPNTANRLTVAGLRIVRRSRAALNLNPNRFRIGAVTYGQADASQAAGNNDH